MSNPVINNTKWDELRLAMYELEPHPAYRMISTRGYVSQRDREWYHHFRLGGYMCIGSVEIFPDTPAQRDEIRSALRTIHVPGEETAECFRVFGHVADGQPVDYF